jgi:hypothetical protein
VRALLAALLLLAPSAGPAPLFRLHDPRLDEISGIAAGIRSPGVVYVQNDSGDSARFFALDAHDGDVLAEYDVPGASNVDWEDIAVAPDADGVASVWLADIGDNGAQRRQIQLYRVREPRVDTAARDRVLTTGAPEVWRLTYPEGAQNAESLAVAPDGTPYVFTKSLIGRTEVYAAPAHSGTATLRHIGSISFGITGTPGPFAPAGELAATGADVSRDGTRLVVRTYTDAYLWTVRGGDVAAALHTRPQRVPLPRQPQGEGVCFARSGLLIDSEKPGSAVYSVPVPAPPPAPSTPAASPTSKAASPAATRTTAVAGSGGFTWWPYAMGLLLAGCVVAVAGVVQRRRPHGRPG